MRIHSTFVLVHDDDRDPRSATATAIRDRDPPPRKRLRTRELLLVLTAAFAQSFSPNDASAGEPQAPKPARRKAPPTDTASLGMQLLPARPGQTKPGARANYIYPQSAAQAMGLKMGDEILEFQGKKVGQPSELIETLGKEAIGAEATIQVGRGTEILTLKGQFGSMLKTRQAYHARLTSLAVGKPFAPRSEIVWTTGESAPLAALKGKVGIVVSFHRCSDCIGLKLKKIHAMHETLTLAGHSEWLGFVGIYTEAGEAHEKSRTNCELILKEVPVRFPVGIVRFPGDAPPPGSIEAEPLFQEHGVAILDPDGKCLFLELGHPQEAFLSAFAAAQAVFGPKPAAK